MGSPPPSPASAGASTLRGVARLLLLCNDLPHAAGWVADQARHLATDAAVDRVSCHRVVPPSASCPRSYDWLLEIETRGDAPDEFVDSSGCADLLGDLHLSGARPIALLVT